MNNAEQMAAEGFSYNRDFSYGGDYMVTVEDGVTVVRELDEIVISLEG